MFRNEKGVTLVELLIVIVILGIIAAISVPAVGNIVENAERDSVVTEASNVRNAANLYCGSETDATVCDDDSEDVFGNVNDSDIDLEDYLEGFDGNYKAYYSEADGFYIAINVDGYSYVGPEDDIASGDLLEDGDEGYWDGEEDLSGLTGVTWSPES